MHPLAHRNFCIANLAAQRVSQCAPGGAEGESAVIRRRVVEAPAAQPPLALPMGELSSEARLRGRRQWKI